MTTATVLGHPNVIDLRESKALGFTHPGPINTAEAVATLYIRDDDLGRCHLHAVIAIAVLNGLDLLTTKLALDQGHTEGNPLAALLLRNPWALVACKVLLVAILVAAALTHRRVLVRHVAAAWFVAGVYALVVVLNTAHWTA